MATKHTIWSSEEPDSEYSYKDEKLNLNKRLAGRVICIADLGLWNGRQSAYRVLSNNLNEVVFTCSCDIINVYCDGRNVRADGVHHDGTNHYLFREVREDKRVDNLLSKIYNGTATSADISRYTRSLVPHICKIYGWQCRGRVAETV